MTPTDKLTSVLANASDGEVIVLGDGTYHVGGSNEGEAVDAIITKSITIRALNNGKAILDGRSEVSVLTIDAPNATVTLEGLVLTRCLTCKPDSEQPAHSSRPSHVELRKQSPCASGWIEHLGQSCTNADASYTRVPTSNVDAAINHRHGRAIRAWQEHWCELLPMGIKRFPAPKPVRGNVFSEGASKDVDWSLAGGYVR